MNKKRQRVAVGLSGGVDSAVAAWRLKRAGWEVIGLTMSIWDGAVPIPDLGISGCFGPGEARDLEAAREVAARVGIEHQVVALAEEYRRTVLDYFREEYLAGRTPNPCVRCNQRMKFGFLLEQARAQGVAFDKFATGHYARTNYDDTRGRWQLLRGRDAGKDQSYFLARLAQDQLAGLIFPLGDLQKDEVKAIARELGWADLAERAESQDFIECGDYSVLFSPEEAIPGNFVDLHGNILGTHRGIIHYTIGQRKGLGIGGQGDPLYVVATDPEHNRVVLGPKRELFTPAIVVSQMNWLVDPESSLLEEPLIARIRLGHKGAIARITERDSDRMHIEFSEPQISATPGQVLVLYHNDGVVASGIIERR